jgi:hypothetical protein
MATSKKAQVKAGVPAARRGQQMGDETSSRDKKEFAEERTPALRGRRKDANKFFADESAQQVASRGEVPRDNTPSVPAAVPTNTKLGESGGEREFKQRQKAGAKSAAGGAKAGTRGGKK